MLHAKTLKMISNKNIGRILKRLSQQAKSWTIPSVSELAGDNTDPFRVLISTVLSLRTKDDVTLSASRRLFGVAGTPATMAELSLSKLEKLIYPVAFYRTKARHIKDICTRILTVYDGNVPSSIDELLKFKGVGRKTANLTVILGFQKPGMCVDTHVHRISNRFGYIRTRTPDESEMVLRRQLPRRFWMTYNDLLVAFGQNICRPVSPICSACNISECPREGVTKSR